ncbi:MAG: S8 family serine peptidase, partial [Actinobacteria bacterium]|nr:S8 family serine peptidase [Actinomycetota bacterium]
MKRFASGLLALGLISLVIALSPTTPATERVQSPTDDSESHAGGSTAAPARRDRSAIGRYFVQIDSPSVSDLVLDGAPSETETATIGPRLVAATQAAAIDEVTASGGKVLFRYSRLFNGFSATMSAQLATEIAERRDVISVEPIGLMKRTNSSSVPFIGAKKVWRRYGVSGEGMKVAVIDTGIDYTHKDFGGAGTRAAFNDNDPTIIEPGSFPTTKIIDGYDFVGASYDVLDQDASNDTPEPDPAPLDDNGHGTHVAGTCCGKGVPGKVGRGVAFKARILAYKVWGQGGSSSADVLVAAYERAVDPNEDGDFSDAPDVLSFSGAVPYGSPTALESMAAERVVDLGIVFVGGAGNSGHQTTDGQAYGLGAPASASGVIAVAASSDPDDGIASFSSQGPARGSHELKPDVTAPGVDIHSADRGSGDEGRFVSGTSMATPHVSGVATLLLQLHPTWNPAQVKAAIMNHAKPELFENARSEVPATVKGAGRVRAPLAARAVSFAIPASLSFGVQELTSSGVTQDRIFTLSNNDDRRHRYDLASNVSYSDHENGVVRPRLSVDGAPFSSRSEVRIDSKDSVEVAVRLEIDPRLITRAEEELRFYEFLPGVDGGIEIHQEGGGQDDLRVPWHVIPLAVSDNAADKTSLDLSAGADELSFPSEAAGRAAADLYVLGATDPAGDAFGEED